MCCVNFNTLIKTEALFFLSCTQHCVYIVFAFVILSHSRLLRHPSRLHCFALSRCMRKRIFFLFSFLFGNVASRIFFFSGNLWHAQRTMTISAFEKQTNLLHFPWNFSFWWPTDKVRKSENERVKEKNRRDDWCGGSKKSSISWTTDQCACVNTSMRWKRNQCHLHACNLDWLIKGYR